MTLLGVLRTLSLLAALGGLPPAETEACAIGNTPPALRAAEAVKGAGPAGAGH